MTESEKASTSSSPASRPLRLAAVATSWRHGGGPAHFSHAEVILTRWLAPLPGDAVWGWPGPRSVLSSVYVEQLHDDDAIYQICRAHEVRLAASIDQALTLGGDALAVDGVLLIGEHGEYPRNELGQKLYPRKAMFDQIVATFDRTGQSVPVFCDKHFSWDFDSAQQMVRTADEMGFLLFGGSSVPHCALSASLPDFEASPPREVVAVYSGGIESYGFHSMEMVQSRIERRLHGEAGVRAVTTYEGDSLTDAMRRGEWLRDLFDAAVRAAGGEPGSVQPHIAFVLDHADGLRVTHINAQGLTGWALVVQCADDPAPHAARAIMGDRDDFHAHFARLARVIEDTMHTNTPPFPIERTLLATGALAAAMQGRAQPGTTRDTPELMIRYQPQNAASADR